jgi:NADPH-dependent 2,4-dienoyl-CoA reductase/sulfur reductase-like enzyme
VTHVDCEAKKATVVDHASKESTTHEYDYMIAASGLRRVWPVAPRALTRKQYLIEASEHIHTVDNAKDGVVVVGGGAVGIEVAAELKLVKPHVKVTLVHSRDKLLSSEGLSEECKDKALELLREGGVEVLLSHRLKGSRPVDNGDGAPRFVVEFTNGKTMVASEVVMAISRSVSTTTYLPTSALDENGLVKIRPKCVAHQQLKTAAIMADSFAIV